MITILGARRFRYDIDETNKRFEMCSACGCENFEKRERKQNERGMADIGFGECHGDSDPRDPRDRQERKEQR